MRLRTLIKLLAVGLTARALLRYQRDRRQALDRGPARDLFARDPDDMVQGFDDVFELQVEPLEVDARSIDDIEAAQDLAGLEVELAVEIEQLGRDDDAVVEMIDIEDLALARDGGELYGGHTPAAVDRRHPDSDEAFAEGQSWLEALETSAIENGAEPGHELDSIASDEELLRPPHASVTRDVPIADYGSGGRRGL